MHPIHHQKQQQNKEPVSTHPILPISTYHHHHHHHHHHYYYYSSITTTTTTTTTHFDRRLKKDDFPTLGIPTIPILTLFLGRPNLTGLTAGSSCNGGGGGGGGGGGHCVVIAGNQVMIGHLQRLGMDRVAA